MEVMSTNPTASHSRENSPGPNRIKSFKNAGKDIEEMRRRRQETSVELRKQKKDDQLLKRRNVCIDDVPLSPEQPEPASKVTITLEEIIHGIANPDPAQQLHATQGTRKMLSRERDPPIDTIIEAGLVTPLVNFLDKSENPALQFEAAWALTNIASGTSEQTQAVVRAGAIVPLVRLLRSPNPNVAEQSVWALGNIAGDGSQLRDFVISAGIMNPLLELVKPDTEHTFLRNLTWTLSNLCRNKNPFPPFEMIKQCLPVLSKLVCHSDRDVQADACWAFSYITDGPNDKIQAVIDAGIIPSIVQLLASKEISVVTPALRTVGNIVTGTDAQTDEVIKHNVLPIFTSLLQHSKSNIVKEAAWAISNITAGNDGQIQKGDFKSQKEAAWAITNFTSGGTVPQIVALVQQGILQPFCDLLDSKDAKATMVVLDGISNILKAADALGEVDRVAEMIEMCKGLDKIEMLQNHENESIYKKSLDIIEKYFSAEDEDEEIVTSTSQSYEFASNGSVPDGGFSF